MYINKKILVGKSEDEEVYLLPSMANRHGLITGASGSGKTITLKVMAESFSDAGVPVFLADVKGDLAATALMGEENENILKRVEKLKLEDFTFKKYPVRFFDIYGVSGHPVRCEVENIGSTILSMMLGLSEAQEGILDIAFKVAKDENLRLLDLKDLRIILKHLVDNKSDYTIKYGNITSQSVGVIERSLLSLENQGADKFFGEPSLDIHDFLAKDDDGRGVINILHAVKLFTSPDLYSAFMLWLLMELFNKLPEVGDLDKPKIVFFFDEAHLLFSDMPGYRLKKLTQIIKLIRSRGIGLYFISQTPLDIPGDILGQLGNRVQHTLRAYTPMEQKIVKTVAQAFRENKKFNTYDAILSLGTGEALVSFQKENGEPSIVEKVVILPPQSKMGTIDEISRNKIINNSPLVGKYDEMLDRESAFELISKKYEEKEEQEKNLLRQKEEEKLRKEEEKKEEKQRIEEERKRKEEERLQKEKEKMEAKAKKEEEQRRKNNPVNKLTKKVANKAVDKVINKGLNTLFKSIFK